MGFNLRRGGLRRMRRSGRVGRLREDALISYSGTHDHLEPGQAFAPSAFDASVSSPDGFDLAGQKDFPRGGYDVRAEDGVQIAEIFPDAKTNGDAGIVKTFEAHPGEEYAVTAEARIRDSTPGFKARLTIAAKRHGGRQVEEFNDRLTEASGEFVRMEIPSAVMPEGTELVTVKFRAHTKAPGDSGVAELRALRFSRTL